MLSAHVKAWQVHCNKVISKQVPFCSHITADSVPERNRDDHLLHYIPQTVPFYEENGGHGGHTPLLNLGISWCILVVKHSVRHGG